MKTAISNLAWPLSSVSDVAPRLRSAGMDGVEIAPTAVWPDAPDVPLQRVRDFAQKWQDHGLAISGVQSLLYGHPELQLFDRSSWPDMIDHLTAMIRLAGTMQADVAVFGSPKNRIRGSLGESEAMSVSAAFFNRLVPVLAECDVVMTLEPNAPEYGADFLVHYEAVVALADLVDSAYVQPQIDTGCLLMAGDDPVSDVVTRPPGHVHISAPNLKPPPGPLDHPAMNARLVQSEYKGWVVLEMLPEEPEPLENAVAHAEWLAKTYDSGKP